MNLTQPYQLRPYQEELVQKIKAEWDAGNRRVLAQLATGGGKTVIFSSVAEETTSRGKGVLVLAHREELLLQAKEKLEVTAREEVGIIKTGYRANKNALIQVASVQSLIRRESWPDAELVIVDEAHHSCADTYVKILDYYSDSLILGVSGSPARSDGRGLKGQYDSLVLGWSVRKLIDEGYLSKFKLFASTKRIKTTGIKIINGDFDQRQLAQAVSSSITSGDIISTWKKHALHLKTIVFCCNVKHSQDVAKAYRQAGYMAEHIDGKTPAQERAAIVQRYKNGETLILCNCGIFSEGVDVPSIQAVQILRPTRSLLLFLQSIGRGLRPSKDKEYLIILDHTDNWIYHGLPDDEYDWTLDAVSLKNRQHAVECPDCNHCFFPTITEQNKLEATCPNCGSIIPLEAPVEGFGAENPEITNDKTIDLEEVILEKNSEIMAEIMKLKAIQVTRNYKPFWIYHQVINTYPEIGLGELRELSKIFGYHPRWAWHKWHELQAQGDKQSA